MTNTELEQSQAEVLRRVGRNLLLFQEIETCLKNVLANHQCEGTAETYQANKEKKTKSINKMMLGSLTEKYKTEVLQDAGENVPDEERPAGWFAYSFRISGETGFIEALRDDLRSMTEARNDLVHNFLPRWQPESLQAMSNALAYLDEQRTKVLPMYDHVRKTVENLTRVKRLGEQIDEALCAPEFQQQLEKMYVRVSPLVSLLRDVAAQHHRADGWTYLALAGDLAKRAMPEELENLEEYYGFATLKKLLIGCELFEVFDEPVNGGFRTLYKDVPPEPV